MARPPYDFTPTERRLLRVLADGLPHRKGDLLACMPDEAGLDANVATHIYRIRLKLAVRNHTIVQEQVSWRVYSWRLVSVATVETYGSPDAVLLTALANLASNGNGHSGVPKGTPSD